MDWSYEIKEGFIVPRTGFEPVTYGLEICWFFEEKMKEYCSFKKIISKYSFNHYKDKQLLL